MRESDRRGWDGELLENLPYRMGELRQVLSDSARLTPPALARDPCENDNTGLGRACDLNLGQFSFFVASILCYVQALKRDSVRSLLQLESEGRMNTLSAV